MTHTTKLAILGVLGAGVGLLASVPQFAPSHTYLLGLAFALTALALPQIRP